MDWNAIQQYLPLYQKAAVLTRHTILQGGRSGKRLWYNNTLRNNTS